MYIFYLKTIHQVHSHPHSRCLMLCGACPSCVAPQIVRRARCPATAACADCCGSGIAPSAGAFAPSSDYPGVCSWWPSGPTPCQPWLAEASQAPVADSNTQVAASPGRTCHHGPHTCPAQLPIPFHISRTATSHRTHVRSISDARSSRPTPDVGPCSRGDS